MKRQPNERSEAHPNVGAAPVAEPRRARDSVTDLLRKIKALLEAEGIPYAVVGGRASATPGEARTTYDLDSLAPLLKALCRNSA